MITEMDRRQIKLNIFLQFFFFYLSENFLHCERFIRDIKDIWIFLKHQISSIMNTHKGSESQVHFSFRVLLPFKETK